MFRREAGWTCLEIARPESGRFSQPARPTWTISSPLLSKNLARAPARNVLKRAGTDPAVQKNLNFRDCAESFLVEEGFLKEWNPGDSDFSEPLGYLLSRRAGERQSRGEAPSAQVVSSETQNEAMKRPRGRWRYPLRARGQRPGLEERLGPFGLGFRE